MIAVLAFSIILLLIALVFLDLADRQSPIEWAESNVTFSRVARMQTVMESVTTEQRGSVLESLSGCHDGYTISTKRFEAVSSDKKTDALQKNIALRLNTDPNNVSVGYAILTRDDFSYRDCADAEIALPMTAIVISTQLQPGDWLHTEVHPHEWHLQDLIARILRYSSALIAVGLLALFLIRRISQPLNSLTDAAKQFADGLKVSPVGERGPPDLKRAIQSFNAMQQQVADDVKKRTDTLAAISHDLRTPLTALRIKAELIDDEVIRADLVSSIDKMDKMISSALEHIRGEALSEPQRTVDLSVLLASECFDFEETDQRAEFVGELGVNYFCRPDALARAVRNLIENANKYGDGARVDLQTGSKFLEIVVSDNGPGIPADQIGAVLEPFRRLSKARESDQGGFGLGLTIVAAIAKVHNGELELGPNEQSGLVATIRLPATSPTQRPV